MEISIDHKALQWFKEELRIKHGESIRFNVRYGGDRLHPARLFFRNCCRESRWRNCVS